MFALAGGWLSIPVAEVFPPAEGGHPSLLIEGISIGVPLLGVALAYGLFLGRQISADGLVNSPTGRGLHRFWHEGWRFDALYHALWVRPYLGMTSLLRREPVDRLYNAVVAVCRGLHSGLSNRQSGRMRHYATVMVVGVIILLGIVMRAAA